MDFYTALCSKGYKNNDIDEFLLTAQEEISAEEINLHVKCILEIDRLEVFRKWYTLEQLPETGIFIWKDRFDDSFQRLKELQIDYQVDYILQNS